MTGIILAAGFGLRFDRSGKPVNKAFLNVGNCAAIDVAVNDMLIPEISGIHIVHNALNSPSFKRWKSGLVRTDGFHIRFPYLKLHSSGAKKPEESIGAMGCLALTLERLGESRPFVIQCVDTLCTYSLRLFLDSIRRDCAALAVCDLGHRTDLSQYGKIDVDDNGYIKNFYEKSEAPYTTVWLGPAYFPASACNDVREYIKETKAVNKSTDNLGNFIAWYLQRGRIQTWLHPERHTVFDLGTRNSWEIARKRFRKTG
jgi:NDP-sugar pyrophosphorylase family protein